MRSAEQIVALYRERKKRQDPRIITMETVLSIYEGRFQLPLPELDRNEKPAVANLMGQGIDAIAMRMASVSPNVVWPSVKPGFKEHDERARRRTMAHRGWWEANKSAIHRRRRARHLVAFAASPVNLRPWEREGIPKWSLRDPMGTFPASTENPDDVNPDDCVHTFTRSLGWLQANYPDQAHRLYKGRDPKLDDLYTCLEYVDAEQITMLALCKPGRGEYDRDVAGSNFELLVTVPNRAEMCTTVVPGRITLDKPQGQFDQLVGIYWTQAMLTALEIHAVKRGVFQELWFEQFQGETNGDIIEHADGPAGIVGRVKGGQIKPVPVNPGFATNATIDRLERAERLTGGIPSDLQGESGSNIRTGRRGDSLLAAVLDFPIQEGQEMLAASEEWENRIGVAIAKGYFKSRPVSMYIGDKGARGSLTYKAEELFDSDRNLVQYAMAGADSNGLVIGAGQRVGLGSLSIRSFQELDPMVQDPEQEHDRVVAERIEAGILGEFEVPGSFGLVDKARVMELVKTNKKELADAILLVQREAQERQAANVDPVDPGDPEAQPGLQAGMGAEAATAAPPDSSLEGLLSQLGGQTKLAGSLRLGQRSSPQEESFAQSTVAS